MTIDLPDELIIQILSFALPLLPAELFESQIDVPQTHLAVQSLTVCKSWHRIGTPLLYHSIILRSSSQAEALALSLRENKNYGRLIEQLRIEGGYGGVTYNIVKAASKVKVLCLTLYIAASDNVSGLCRALPMLRPTRVVLYDRARRGLDNKQTLMLHETLNFCIRKWKTMKQLYFPYSEALGLHSTSTPVDSLAQAIKEAPALRELEMPFGYSFPKHLMVMAENPHLRVIRVYRQHVHAGITFNFEHTVESVGRLKKLVVYVDDPTRTSDYGS